MNNILELFFSLYYNNIENIFSPKITGIEKDEAGDAINNEVSQSDKNMTNTETSPNANCEPSEQVKVREDEQSTILKSTYEATICNDPNNQEQKADIEDLTNSIVVS